MLDRGPYPANILSAEYNFFQRLQQYNIGATVYADPIAHAVARSLIPLDELRGKAGVDSDELCRQLLSWFKRRFFTWVDTLPCENCTSKTVADGSLDPSSAELQFGGERVEAHRCTVCQHVTRFPRYNNPVKLLETRRGRCGEWANCFTLCASSMGLEARLVHDETDHVWTEVFSPKGRWVHADACEEAWDRPLMYEAGWGKALSYCVAFSPSEVVDVSWRYARDHAAMRSRRLQARESRLVDFLGNLRRFNQRSLTEAERLASDRRLVTEMVGLMSAPKAAPKPGETEGRSSGSLEWRAMRSELGEPRAPPRQAGRSLKPTPEEWASAEFRLEYESSTDRYRRPKSAQSQDSPGWDSCLFKMEHVGRKVELDHGQVYLAREEGWSGTGRLVWRVDVSAASSEGVDVVAVEVGLRQNCFSSGRVSASVCCGDVCGRVPAEGPLILTDGLEGAESVEVAVELDGGDGDCAWQHAQILRSPLQRTSTQPPLYIAIRFQKKSNSELALD